MRERKKNFILKKWWMNLLFSCLPSEKNKNYITLTRVQVRSSVFSLFIYQQFNLLLSTKYNVPHNWVKIFESSCLLPFGKHLSCKQMKKNAGERERKSCTFTRLDVLIVFVFVVCAPQSIYCKSVFIFLKKLFWVSIMNAFIWDDGKLGYHTIWSGEYKEIHFEIITIRDYFSLQLHSIFHLVFLGGDIMSFWLLHQHQLSQTK